MVGDALTNTGWSLRNYKFSSTKKKHKMRDSQPGAIRYKPYLGKKSAHMMINLRRPIGTAICVDDKSYRSEESTEGWEEWELGRWKRIRGEGNEACLEIYYFQGYESEKWQCPRYRGVTRAQR